MRTKKFHDRRSFWLFYAAVAKRTWQKAWYSVLMIPLYIWLIMTGDSWWWLNALEVACILGFSGVVFHRWGRSTAELEFFLQTKQAKEKALSELRAKMIADGVPDEEASLAIMRLDLEL